MKILSEIAAQTVEEMRVLPQNLWVDFRIWRPEQLPG
jgi:hypothetical protein